MTLSWPELLQTTILTLKVGLVAMALILLPGVALGYVLARFRFRGRALLTTVVSLPIVLPPVAIGLLLMLTLARDTPVGRLCEQLIGEPILLTWQAAAIASAVMSFPLLVLGAREAFAGVPRRVEQVAATLGASRWRVFSSITLPLAARGILHGLAFAFARGLGEFGATTLVAGHVPGRSETIALAIHDRIERFEDGDALLLSLASIVIALAFTGAAEAFLKDRRR